ncbi:MAG: DNA recombination protein RmuC [Clostridiales bacterium]|nr:DNA recombination protein RmuC [Clostridiales bacterium]
MLQQSVIAQLSALEQRMAQFTQQNERQLEQMRSTVDERLQKTLEERLGQSFRTVSSQLEQVHRGIGEMQRLAVGVDDLRKVLGNVKTRGIWGEYQLSAILEQILSPEQYACNVAPNPAGRETVEFAIRLPGDGDRPVYLPIDAKFPLDGYAELVAAAEEGDARRVAAATSALTARLRSFARDVRDKYIHPPYTTDFAILFLPTEALYAEVVKLGLVDALQREYKVSIAGPTTMGALLNSLQMGFRTLTIQQRSAEVWRVLSAAKAEFAKFGEVLEGVRKRLSAADRDLERLVGTRTNVINRALRGVETLAEEGAAPALEDYVPPADREAEDPAVC